MSSIAPENRFLIEKLFKEEKLKKTPSTTSKVISMYKEEYDRRGFTCGKLSRATIYRLWDKVDEATKILHQQGKRAAREFNRAKLGRTRLPGFHASAQADAYHEPILLRDPFDFSPLNKRPVHHYVVETETSVMMGFASNYLTGSERAEFVIDSLKMAFLPKPTICNQWGTRNSWPVYGKTYELVMDAGAGYNCSDSDTFLSLCHVSTMLTRTRRPEEKPLVETINKVIKYGLTFNLPGAYRDNAPKDAKDSKENTEPVLTTLEHQVLHYRYIVDDFNQSINNEAHHGMTRTEHWLYEAARKPPVLPHNPRRMMEYLGKEDRKTIMDKVGIQITVMGVPYVYNSPELQEIGKRRRNDFQDRVKRRVSLKWSLNHPEFILVRNPYTKETIQVQRISNDRGDTARSRARKYNLPPVFYEMQDLEVLTKMSTQDILDHAHERQRLIKQHERFARQRNARRATTIEEAARRNQERFLTPVHGAYEDPMEWRDQLVEETSGIADAPPTSFAAQVDWTITPTEEH